MKNSRDYYYLAAAILCSPILGVFCGSVVRDLALLVILDFESWIHNIPAFVVSGGARAILGLVLSLPVVLLYGVPVHFLLKKLDLQNLWMYCLFGLLPAICGVILFWSGQNNDLASLNIYSTSLAALDGAFTAIFFWLLAVYIPAQRDRND